MNIVNSIARRYIFGKKSTNAINVITGISIFGISVGTAALILILSVFNGFESIIQQQLNVFNPDIQVEIKEGKTFHIEEAQFNAIKNIEGIRAASRTIEEVALFEYHDSQKDGILKGVDRDFQQVIGIDSALIEGEFLVEDLQGNYAVSGAGIASELGLNIGIQFSPVTIYLPKKKKKGILDKDFKIDNLSVKGIFAINNDNEYSYMLTSLDHANELLESEDMASALEIKLTPAADQAQVIHKLKTILGDEYAIKNRYDQDNTYLKIMNIEKWMSFLIVSLTLLIVAFNLIGSLWMIVLEKKKDIAILQAMGSTPQQIRNIFLNVGIQVTLLGMIIGFGLALVFYALQKTFGIVPIPSGFIIDSYPIKLKIIDFLSVTLVVIFIGVLASLPPAFRAARIPTFIRED